MAEKMVFKFFMSCSGHTLYKNTDDRKRIIYSAWVFNDYRSFVNRRKFLGAKVLGNVILGNNSIVGANAVVVKNVPADCTVVGVPAYIVKRSGKKVKENL